MDLTCSQVGNKLAGKKSSELLAEQVGQSKNQIFRFIRLTELIPELLDMVDEKKIALNPAYELSFARTRYFNVFHAFITTSVNVLLADA